uniref:WD_REPEATS_REGION domain-containing protein n=1 Tax=Steinernema glaseri TaxID=37863 RepID=A0A1I8AAK1_9BILA
MNRDAVERLVVAAESSEAYSALIVDPKTGSSTWSLKGNELYGATLGQVVPVGQAGEHLLLTVPDKPLLHVIAVHNRNRLHQKSVTPGPVRFATTTRDGAIVFCAIGAQIFAWMLHSGDLLAIIDAHYQAITKLLLCADDSILVSCSQDGTVNVYLVADIISGGLSGAVEPYSSWTAHGLAVTDMCVTLSQNPRILTCSADHSAVLRGLSLPEPLLKVCADRPFTACAMDPAESRAFLGTDKGAIVQVSLFSAVESREYLISTHDETFPIFVGHSAPVTRIVVNADGSTMASGDQSGGYFIWDVLSRQCLKESSMKASISTLFFTSNWPSLNDNDYKKSDITFGLLKKTKNTNAMMIPILSNGLSEQNAEDIVEWFLERNPIDKKEVQKPDDSADRTKDAETIAALKKDIAKLKKANKELFEYAKKSERS